MEQRRKTRPPIAHLLFLCSTLAAAPAEADAPGDATQKADAHFDALLANAKAAPAKTDWKALRRAFAETSYYAPDNIHWRMEVGKSSKQLSKGETKNAEASLLALQERERWMRIEIHILLVTLYEKTNRADKARPHQAFVDGISSTLIGAETGASFEKAIPVLFTDEEYYVLQLLKQKPLGRSFAIHDGHHFSIHKVPPDPGAAERLIYFNVDFLQRDFRRSSSNDQ